MKSEKQKLAKSILLSVAQWQIMSVIFWQQTHPVNFLKVTPLKDT